MTHDFKYIHQKRWKSNSATDGIDQNWYCILQWHHRKRHRWQLCRPQKPRGPEELEWYLWDVITKQHNSFHCYTPVSTTPLVALDRPPGGLPLAPCHYRRMSLYLSQEFQHLVPISARTEFLSGKAYTNVTTVSSQISPSSNLEQLCYMLLLACSRILENFNMFSSSSLKIGIEMRLWLLLQILAVEVQCCWRNLDERYCVRSDTELTDQQ